MRYPFLLFICWLAGLLSISAAQRSSSWENSVVSLEASRRSYDYLQPWARRQETVTKSGVVIGPRQILTTADYLHDITLVRVQKNGRGPWYSAKLAWIDYHANLALVTSADSNLWSHLKPASWLPKPMSRGQVELVRWRNGRLESFQGDIQQWAVKKGKLTWVDYLQMEVSSEINAAGWAEAVVVDNKLVGITSSHADNRCTVLPAPFVRPILQAQNQNRFPGLGYFDFVWQKIENPDILAYLKLTGAPRGVVVVDGGLKLGHASPIQPMDLIVKIDGLDIDNEGDYQDPDYGKLSIENIASGRLWANRSVPIQVWRSGELKEVAYTIPKVDYADELVPLAHYDQEPEYLIAGGLVFQPLTEPYLRSWGSDWRRKAPFRLVYYTLEKPSVEKPSRVLLSTVLPDRTTIGYQDHRFLVIERVNNRPISRLNDLAEALKSPVGGFQVIEFAPGESVGKLVLNASRLEDATARVLQHFGIQKDRHLSSP
ncbi:MAG TPA: hypothetical protein P5186_11490 [Candidatus Paceibacterota bacterium]|nr:hypothetical protein [Verrucomicrobiota bacterium]HRY48663.1 hypothetical protein [Candidatus Paceibacterota bacterium]